MILASASPRRLELLSALGIDPRVRPADIDETRLPGEAPVDLVLRLAQGKAHASAAALDERADDILLAADTIVWDDKGDVLGKPHDAVDATHMLKVLSGATHHVSTGVCACLVKRGEVVDEGSFVETTRVTFCDLTDSEIAAYVASGEPMDKAGAYGIQGRGVMLVREIAGDYQNVVGLPVNRTLRMIDDLLTRNGMRGVVTDVLGGHHG